MRKRSHGLTMASMLFLTLFLTLPSSRVNAFCGFYVAKADATLFNKSSQVILVRDGERTVVTMSSDYQGELKDFAMVVPVPVVLGEDDIRVVKQSIFSIVDAYTAPRLVEYYDENPCWSAYYAKDAVKGGRSETKSEAVGDGARASANALGVTIEAKYSVGEYEILILSATESSGLKTWLTDNGYKIPDGAEEVLDPYIKEGMKFFVAKVDLGEAASRGVSTLSPLQIQYNHSRFMLPIRLGMANATGAQDMQVYAFTKRGRVECSNYRTTMVPTNRDIPEFIMGDNLFGDFYKSVYDRHWAREGRNTVSLEYAWDLSGRNYVKCDPCVSDPISYSNLVEAGVWWVKPNGGSYSGDLFVTRLHLRYGRKTFPQDLLFMNTSDQSNFQARYVVHHPAQGELKCEAGQRYLRELSDRRKRELEELQALTGWNKDRWKSYAAERDAKPDVVDVPAVDSAVSAPVGQVASDPGPGSDTAQRTAEGEAFLADGPRGGGGLGTRTWLLLLAGGMLVTGIVVRMVGRRKQYSSDGGGGTGA